MSVLSSLLGRRPSGERPDLAAWLEGASPALVVDGGGAPAIQGAAVLRHETSGGAGLPFHERDPRRLPAADGSLRALVLADVFGEVLDAAPVLDEAKRVLGEGALLLVAQSVAPEDYEQRAIWNAVARMRDARRTWSASARQLEAVLSGAKLERLRDASWEETEDAASGEREDARALVAALLADAAARGAKDVVRDGRFVVSRRAWLFRRP